MTEEQILQRVKSAGVELAPVLAAQIESPHRQTLFAAIDRCLDTLSSTDVWGTANRLPSGRFWEVTGQWLQHGALLSQARFKPRGYAGDDEMLRRICEDWRCDHPLGSLLDDYFQSHTAPQVVRNRTRIVADAIVARINSSDRLCRVISVGSGPAMDIVWAAEQLNDNDRTRLQVTLLDLDPRALETARERLLRYLPTDNIHPRRENLYRLSEHPQAAAILSGDVIACTGFFDYLSDEAAIALLRALWQSLLPNGHLLVFNFAPHHASQALMEWIGNWYLVYRDTAAMRRLASAATIPTEAFSLQAEATGSDLYIDARQT